VIFQRIGNWLADSVRFVGAMFYWNVRKSIFVWRERSGQCPCQNESDDSVPGRVRCDAMLHWHEPARFQKICPLLVSTPGGWRCSVHASQVRPFWGRVARWCAVSLLALYLTGTLVVFAGLRLAGKAPVGWLQVAWPGKWHEIRGVQSAYLFNQAIVAFRNGKMAEAYVALTSARQRDPNNYDATLLLAQVSMFQRSYAVSDDLFATLWHTHPAEQYRTSVVYHDTLLGTDRMDKLAEFCLVQARVDSARAAIWVRTALLAIRSMRPDTVAALASAQAGALEGLAPHAQLLLRAELDLRTGNGARARASLRRRFDGPFNLVYTEYQIMRLADLGAVAEAQLLLDQQGTYMGDFDHFLTQVAVSLQEGDRLSAQSAFRALFKQPLTGPRVERLAGLLIMHPDASLYRELHARAQREATLEAAVEGAGMWTAGIVCNAPIETAFWRTHGMQPAFANYPDIKSFDFTSRNLAAPNSVSHLINVVSLPREVIMALLWRMAPQPAPVSPGKPRL
jgi:hypothetical protein